MDIFLIFQKHKHLSEPGATHRATMTSNSFYENSAINYLRRKMKNHLWQLSQFLALTMKRRQHHLPLLQMQIPNLLPHKDLTFIQMHEYAFILISLK